VVRARLHAREAACRRDRGTWKPNARTLRDIRGRGRYPDAPHEIRLHTDGTREIVGMPDWWSDVWGESHHKLQSDRGTWRIVESENVWTIYDLELELSAGRRAVHLARQHEPYLIHITMGDPDSGEYMEFERTEKEGA
jgi:hypothetical protein